MYVPIDEVGTIFIFIYVGDLIIGELYEETTK